MNCQELSDKLPAVVRGEIDWSATEAAHLAECADCRREWEVVAAGMGVAREVTIDADAVAVRVVDRLRTDRPVLRFPRPRWLIGLAAAAAVVLILSRSAGPAQQPHSPAAPPTAELVIDVPGLSSLGEEGLAEVLESMVPQWTDTPTIDTPSLDDLDPRELEQVQRLWES